MIRARRLALPEPVADALGRLADRFEAVALGRFAWVERPGAVGRLLMILLVGHVVVWTLQGWLSHNNLADSVDMVENWSWGKEWRLGYWKHPPFFAWVTAAWFALLPRADWAYHLLSATNAAVGLAGIWALTGRVDASPRRRLVAVAALSLTPVYGFLALKFNANAVLLSVWPWASWAFLRALDTRSARDGGFLGLLLAVAMLSKYVSLVLVVGMVAVVLVDRDRWALARSPAALAALGVGLLAFAPHVAEMVATDFRTLEYAEHQRAESIGQFLNYLVRLPLSMLLFLTPMVAALLVAVPRDQWRALAGAASGDDVPPGRRRVLGLFAAPWIATCALGAWKGAKLSSQWGFPLLFTASWLTVTAPGLDEKRLRLDRLALAVALAWGALLATAPIVDVVGTLSHAKVFVEPRAELGREVTRIWRETTGTRLAALAGTFDLAHNVDFYSPDAPSVLIEFDWLKSPWMKPERVARSGIAVVCAPDDAPCPEAARRLFGDGLVEREVTVAKSWFGLRLKPLTVRLFLRLPTAGA